MVEYSANYIIFSLATVVYWAHILAIKEIEEFLKKN